MAIKEIVSRIFAGLLSIFATALLLFALGMISKIFITVFKLGYRIVL